MLTALSILSTRQGLTYAEPSAALDDAPARTLDLVQRLRAMVRVIGHLRTFDVTTVAQPVGN